MITILNQRPAIGIFSGFTSGVLYFLKTVFTDDLVLKWIAGMGIWMGLLVALLTVWLRVIEIRKSKITSHNK